MKVVLPETEGWGFGILRTQWLIELYNKVTLGPRMTFWPLASISFQIPISKSPNTPTYVYKSSEWHK